MNSTHPLDMLLQQYATGKTAVDKDTAKHIDSCSICQVSVANYRLLFAAIQQEPKPAFNFDATELVLNKLPARTANVTKNKIPAYMMVIALSVVVAPLYFFRKLFINVAGGVSTVLLLAITAAAVSIVLYRAIGLYKKYQEQLDKLNFY